MPPSPLTTSSPPLKVADRVASGPSSEVRQIFQTALKRTGIISFANGSPYLGELPFHQLADDAHRIVTEFGSTALQYGASNGIPELRRHIVDLMAIEGVAADPEQVIVTAGSQQALGFAAHATINPGDVVFAESPSYAGAMAVFAAYEAEIVHVPGDRDGLIPAEFECLVRVAWAAGKLPRMLYTVPNFQNPGGMNLSAERRILLGRICQEQGLLLFEDNPYGLLGFDGATMRAIQPDAPDITFYFGSFSKMFAPGLRLGWLLAPEALHQPLTDIAQTAALNPSVFNQLLLTAYLDGPSWRDTLARYRGLYRAKLEALVGALTEHMPAGTTWDLPAGGFYLWVTVPQGIDTHELVHEAIERGVAYVPGTAIYTNGAGRSELRLSFCLPSVEEIRDGAAILGRLFSEALA
ncbi:PLP-dependent aminotransferase family protein [Arthrobacter sp. PM3]|uniref:aminotransferase-like domain-containing protein n=1 Tax=Arthrobacter sp. PM3 TaxID=2017685 RepID=UPI001ABFC07F|nr:PLP-dependent aminotransferase family protein [Arthrobacter sp. PM3]